MNYSAPIILKNDTIDTDGTPKFCQYSSSRIRCNVDENNASVFTLEKLNDGSGLYTLQSDDGKYCERRNDSSEIQCVNGVPGNNALKLKIDNPTETGFTRFSFNNTPTTYCQRAFGRSDRMIVCNATSGSTEDKQQRLKYSFLNHPKSAQVYLDRNADLRQAYWYNRTRQKGETYSKEALVNAYKHYRIYGRNESRNFSIQLTDNEAQCYLIDYPDVAEYLKNIGKTTPAEFIQGAKDHFASSGIYENRVVSDNSRTCYYPPTSAAPTTTPYATTPYTTTPYITTPYATTPYATTPYATTPFSTTPRGSTTPYGTTPLPETPFSTTPHGTTPNPTTTPYGTTPNPTTTPYGTTPNPPTTPYGTTPNPTTTPYGTTPRGSTTPYGTTPNPTTTPYGTTPLPETPFSTTPRGSTTPHGTTPNPPTTPYGTTPNPPTTPYGTTPRGSTTPYGTTPNPPTTPFSTTPRGSTTPYGTTPNPPTTPYGTTPNPPTTPYGTTPNSPTTPYGTTPNPPTTPSAESTTGFPLINANIMTPMTSTKKMPARRSPSKRSPAQISSVTRAPQSIQTVQTSAPRKTLPKKKSSREKYTNLVEAYPGLYQ